MRYLNKSAIHGQAVIYGRSRPGMKRTANRLAKCNVDRQVDSLLRQLKPNAWNLPDETIIQGCAQRLWLEFCQAEINIQLSE